MKAGYGATGLVPGLMRCSYPLPQIKPLLLTYIGQTKAELSYHERQPLMFVVDIPS